MLVEWAQQGGLSASGEEGAYTLLVPFALAESVPDARLTDVLSPANISQLLSSHPLLIPTLTPLLPPDLNIPPNPTAKDLLPVLSAPQFTDAIASLDNALRSGGLPGSMMRELGLPEEAGRGVKEFLEGLKGLGTSQVREERMDED